MTQPIGLTVLGGLTFGSLMTLFVMPSIYYIFNTNADRKAAKKARRQAAKERRKAARKERELPEIIKRHKRAEKKAAEAKEKPVSLDASKEDESAENENAGDSDKTE